MRKKGLLHDKEGEKEKVPRTNGWCAERVNSAKKKQGRSSSMGLDKICVRKMDKGELETLEKEVTGLNIVAGWEGSATTREKDRKRQCKPTTIHEVNQRRKKTNSL